MAVTWQTLLAGVIGTTAVAALQLAGPWLAALVIAAGPWILREPRRLWLSAASFAAVWMLLRPDAGAIVASQMLPRAAAAALLWISRPAAQEIVDRISSAGVVVAMLLGIAAAAFTGAGAFLMLACAILAIRAAQALSYQCWGGVNTFSAALTRHVLEITVLAAARLPIAFLYSGAH
jgi:hypothetical protein